jgi:hypothetical protein
MEYALPFWWDLTIYCTVMISIMSWEGHHSKPITETGQTNQWSTTSLNELQSLLVKEMLRRTAVTDEL